MPEFIELEKVGRVAVIHLRRPKMNALNRQMQDELGEVAQLITDDSEIRAAVIYGGEKTFAAGADIKEMVNWDLAEAKRQAGPLQAGFNAIANLPIPTIAAVTGYALGGGCELALCCDLRIAGDNAQLGQPEILLGIIPGAGGTQRLTRLIGPSRAKDLVLTGRFVPAAEALSIGLVNEVVPADDVFTRAMELATKFAAGPQLATRAALKLIDESFDNPIEHGLLKEEKAFASLFGTKDQKHGMESFIDNGPGKAIFE